MHHKQEEFEELKNNCKEADLLKNKISELNEHIKDIQEKYSDTVELLAEKDNETNKQKEQSTQKIS